MSDTLDRITIQICENLPLDITILEKKGFCKKPNNYCNYCKPFEEEKYICNKKTYDFADNLGLI